MITKFSFQNFRSFREKATIGFETDEPKGNCTIIYGRNASGKSNIEKAFSYFSQFVTSCISTSLTTERSLIAEPFFWDYDKLSDPSLFEIEIQSNEQIFQYGFEVYPNGSVHREWLRRMPEEANMFKRNGDLIHDELHTKKETGKFRKMTRPNTLFLSVLASLNDPTAMKVVEEIRKIKLLDDMQYTTAIKLTEPPEEVFELFRDSKIDNGIMFFKSSYDGCVLVGRSRRVDNEITSLLTTSLDDESTGIRTFFYLAQSIIKTLKEDSLLVLDAPPCLHTSINCFLIDLFNSPEKNPNNAKLLLLTNDESLMRNNTARKLLVEKDIANLSSLYPYHFYLKKK